MSTTNLLTQNDNLRRELSKEHVGRSVHQIGNNMQFPAWIGPIYPICCKPTIPTQGVKISVSAMISQISPLKVPLSAKLRLNTAFYFVDQRLTWKKWERFMTGGVSGDEKYNLPYYCDILNGYDPTLVSYTTEAGRHYVVNKFSFNNQLRSYFNVGLYEHVFDNSESTSDVANDGMFPEAAPFFGYQMICRDYYTTVDRLPTNEGSHPLYFNTDDDWCYNNLFPANDDDFRLSDGANYKSHGVILGKIRYHEVRQDYFSSCFKSPMRGTAPTLSLDDVRGLVGTLNNLKLDKNATNDLMLGLLRTDDTSTNNVNFRQLETNVPYATSPQDILVTNEVPDVKIDHYGLNGKFGAYLPNQYPDVSGSVSISGNALTTVTSAQLTWLNQITTWKELNILAKPYYRDFLNAHYEKVNIGDEQTERPIYIGGTSQSIDINEVTQTSYSSDSPLGNKGATVHSLDTNFVGSFFCNNHGWIIGVAYIIPDFFYEPALPRYFTRRENLDFYSPEFANLSMQAILNKELFVSSDDDWNNQVLGYTGRFDELRSYPNYVCGDLLNSNFTDLKAWVLARRFDDNHKPAITTKYLNLRDNVDYSAFALGSNMPPFMAQFATDIMASMPMPTVAVPKH